MPISINWATGVIYVPQSELTFISGSTYRLDVDAFRLVLKDLEDNEEGIGFPDTHRHNTEVVLSGITYARIVEIINGYTVEFEDGMYTVDCVGANHNIGDVKVVNQVSLIVGNAAGLIVVSGGTGPTAADIAQQVWQRSIEGGHTAEELMRAIVALGMAAATGGGTNTITFRDLANAKNRLKLKVKDADGNRNTPEILDLT